LVWWLLPVLDALGFALGGVLIVARCLLRSLRFPGRSRAPRLLCLSPPLPSECAGEKLKVTEAVCQKKAEVSTHADVDSSFSAKSSPVQQEEEYTRGHDWGPSDHDWAAIPTHVLLMERAAE
jgi:hypothetical protein